MNLIEIGLYYKNHELNYNKLEYIEARKYLNKIIRINKTSAELYCIRGIIKFHLKDKNYRQDLNIARKLNPKSVFVLTSIADIYYKQCRYYEALNEVRLALRINPKYRYALELRATIYAKNGCLKKAIEEYRRLKENNENIRFRFNKVLLNVEDLLLNFNEYYSTGHKIRKFTKEFLSKLTVMGLLHCFDNEFKEAEKCFDTALMLNQDFAELFSYRAICRDKLKDFSYENIFKDYEKAYELNNSYENLFQLAKCEVLGDYYEDEIYDNLKYSKIFLDDYLYDEDAGEIYYKRGFAYYNANKYVDAIDDFTNAIKNDYDYDEVYIHRALCYVCIGNIKKALKDIKHILRCSDSEDEKAHAYYIRACINLYDLKDFQTALEDCNKAISFQNEYSDMALYIKPDIYYALEDYSQALKFYKLLITKGYDNYEGLAKTYNKLDEHKKALKVLNRGIKQRYSSELFLLRSFVKKDLGDLEGAAKDFEEYDNLLHIKPLCLNQEQLSFYKDKSSNFAKFLSSENKKSHKNIGFYQKRAYFNIANENYRDALKDLTFCIEKQIDNPSLYIERAKIKGLLGDNVGKIKDLSLGFNQQLKLLKTNFLPPYVYLTIFRELNSYTYSSLQERYLWFSHPEEFNDPLDSRFYKNATKDKDLLEIYSKIRIRSFTNVEVSKSNLLWSHYAKNHTGIAIEYEIDAEGIKNKNIVLKQLKYDSQISKFGRYSLLDYGNSFFIKCKDWKYENEWRMVTLEENLINGNRLYDCFKIKSITFGLMTKQKEIDKVKRILGKKCKYYKMVQANNLFFPFEITKEAL